MLYRYPLDTILCVESCVGVRGLLLKAQVTDMYGNHERFRTTAVTVTASWASCGYLSIWHRHFHWLNACGMVVCEHSIDPT